MAIFWKFIQNSIHWDKTRMLNKFPVDTVNFTKCILVSFASFNSSRIYFWYPILKRTKVQGSYLYKCVWDFPFSIPFRFTKSMDSSTVKHLSSFQNKYKNATHDSSPRPLIYKLQQEVLKFNDIYVSWSSPHARPGNLFLKLGKSKLEN